jgi:hypothetical protein
VKTDWVAFFEAIAHVPNDAPFGLNVRSKRMPHRDMQESFGHKTRGAFERAGGTAVVQG